MVEVKVNGVSLSQITDEVLLTKLVTIIPFLSLLILSIHIHDSQTSSSTTKTTTLTIRQTKVYWLKLSTYILL